MTGASEARPRDPWKDAPVGELQDQLLPRWFVLTVILMIAAAVVTLVAAFVVFQPADVPVAARRPPPADGLTNDVGAFEAGELEAVVYEDACPMLEGVRVAGSDADRAVLRRGLAALCNIELTDDTGARLRAFAAAGGVVRFATFELTGVDSTARFAGRGAQPVVYLNTKFARTNPLWIAPLVAHDVTFIELDPSTAEAALEARRTEARVCERLLDEQERSRACRDAAAVVALPEPLEALRDAGYR